MILPACGEMRSKDRSLLYLTIPLAACNRTPENALAPPCRDGAKSGRPGWELRREKTRPRGGRPDNQCDRDRLFYVISIACDRRQRSLA